jgi:cellulose synthase/poly-beta-1,6-N-acetylglucosamine synthase-like glycosyltransferase
MVKMASDLGIGVTAMGNNMIVSRKAYALTGGYENLPFSITEDFQLFNEIRRKGGRTFNDLDADVKAYTEPASQFKALLHQRKRWMRGAVQLPPPMLGLLGTQALFFPVIITGLALQPTLFAAIWLLKVFIQALFIIKTARRAEEREPLWELLMYEFYSACLSLSLLFFYLLPVPVKWKGRSYA